VARAKTDWNRDVPWLGAWLPMTAAIVALGALVHYIGVPIWILGTVGPLLIGGLFWFLWGPNGRLGQLAIRKQKTENSN